VSLLTFHLTHPFARPRLGGVLITSLLGLP